MVRLQGLRALRRTPDMLRLCINAFVVVLWATKCINAFVGDKELCVHLNELRLSPTWSVPFRDPNAESYSLTTGD